MTDPRIPLVDIATLDEDSRVLLEQWSGGSKPANVLLTYLKNTKLNKHWASIAGHLFPTSSLNDRLRELVVMRACWLCKADYEFLRHLLIARYQKLMTEDEYQSIKAPVPAAHWSEEEAAAIVATTELLTRYSISDATWAILSKTMSDQQLIDLVLTAGGYVLNSMATNSFGVQLEKYIEQEEGLTPSRATHTLQTTYLDSAESLNPTPRLAPLKVSDLTPDVRAKLQPTLDNSPTTNIVLTVARYPELFDRWMPFLGYIFTGTTLEPNEVELITLRTTWLCGARYEFTHHAELALGRGLTEADVRRIPLSNTVDGWSQKQVLLLDAVDQLMANKTIDAPLWNALTKHYNHEQLMDIVFACANYFMVSLLLNSARVQLEDTVAPHPAFSDRARIFDDLGEADRLAVPN